MTVAAPQRCTISGIVFKICREAQVLMPYRDGEWKTGPRKGEFKYSQASGSQTRYSEKPYREVRPDDPSIAIEEAIRWSLIGVEEREDDVNRALEVQIDPAHFSMVAGRYYQKGNVRRPLPGDPLDAPTGPRFLDECCGYFNAGEPVKAIASFMLYNSGANNVQTVGHTIRCAREILFAHGIKDDQATYPFFPTVPPDHILRKSDRQERPVQELFDILRELDPTRAV